MPLKRDAMYSKSLTVAAAFKREVDPQTFMPTSVPKRRLIKPKC